jgi:hypothetical protein
MARRVIRGTTYTFNPSAKSIVIPRVVQEERLLLITNITKGTIIYNFAEPNLSAQSFTYTNDPVDPSTTVVLNAGLNTSGMSSTDKLAIMVDELNETVTFSDTLLDAVDKLRVAAPQSLMDTDFEYSVQPSKWESLLLMNNYPSFFPKGTGGNSFENVIIEGNGQGPRSLVTVTTLQFHNLLTGSIVSVQDTTNFRAEGTFLVNSVPTPTTFTYFARGLVSGNIAITNYSTVYGGDAFDNAHIPGGTASTGTLVGFGATTSGGNPSVITLSFTNPHGLFPGTPIVINNTSGMNGNWIVRTVPDPRSLTFDITDQVVTAVSTSSSSVVYTKPEGYVQHRPTDGGVSLTTLSNAMGSQTIRQTRRYFRYQSGKSIQFSTGAKFTPTFDIVRLSASDVGSAGVKTVTVETLQDHGLQPGATILVEGIETVALNNPYNGSFPVFTVNDTNTFTYQVTLSSALPLTDQIPGGTNRSITVSNWTGAVTRTGMFDDQNGFFFEYDGQYMYAVRRFSNTELAGRIAVNSRSGQVIGTGTIFRKQLTVGDRVVIRGQTYVVNNIHSDTEMYINPTYRGENLTNGRMLKTQEIRVRQDAWNFDKMDGTGPSGYVLDPRKMQMVYIDYTWYGAGFIRWGFRTIRGDVVYCHRMANNNINNAAYQRSGNLPARYEVINEPRNARLTAGATNTVGGTLQPNDTTMYVDNVNGWAPSGFLFVKNESACEMMRYTAIGAYSATAKGFPVTVVRRQTYSIFFPGQTVILAAGSSSAALSFNPDQTLGGNNIGQVSVQTVTQTCAPQISHWGSSVIMDGRFDDDSNYTFTAGMQKTLTVATGVARPLLAVRLAPSVDNAIAKNFGNRELINRMQMKLASMGISANGQFLIRGVLNPTTIAYNPHALGSFDVAGYTIATAVAPYSTANSAFQSFINLSSVQNLAIGMQVRASGSTGRVVAGAVITGIFGTTIQLSQPLTAGATIVTADNQTVAFTGTPAYNGLPLDWQRDRVGSGSLAQVIYFDNTGPYGGIVPNTAGQVFPATGSISGGDEVFSFYTENSGTTAFNITNYELRTIRELGNSILSGNGNAASPSYPNSPDVLVITATNIGTAASNISARVSWTEAQA